MPINQTQNTPQNAFANTVKGIKKSIQQFKTNQLKVLVIPNVATDP